MKGVVRVRWLAGAALMVALLLPTGVPALMADVRPAKEKETPTEKLTLKEKEKDFKLPAVFNRATPESVEDLRAIQKQTKEILDKITPATVGLRIGSSAGSGVIVNEEGYILTAGHVSGKPDQNVDILLFDGRRLKGKTLGQNKGIDSGMIKITDKDAKFKWVEMGDSAKVKVGQWCVAIGHPGGFKPGRTPVVRVGRVLSKDSKTIATDCTLVGGDSGGPMFDMTGKVIAIHSRIGLSVAQNYHVPVDTYRETWDRLAKGESWGGGLFDFGSRRPRPVSPAYLGIVVEGDSETCKISEITKGSPAEKAGLKVGDEVTKFDGKMVGNFDDLAGAIKNKKPGDMVEVSVKRGTETLSMKVTLTKRAEE